MEKNTLLSCRTIVVLFFTFLFVKITAYAQTTLVSGDIAIVGYNADETTEEDQFSFILLTDILSGTVINFTDFGWCSDGTGFQTPNSCGASTGALSDGAITWTATSDLPCGTQIKVICGGTSLSATSGNVTGLFEVYNLSGEYMSLAAGGDHVFAFQGTLGTPTFITGISMNGDWNATLLQCEFTSSSSSKPPALNTSNSVAITPEVDNAIYDCSVTNDIQDNLRTAIFNVANWTVDNSNAFTMPLSCSFGCAPLSTESFNLESSISLYPNPTSGSLKLKISKSLEFKKVVVYSVLGRIIRTEKHQEFDLNGFAKGIYYVEVHTNLGKATKHIIVN